jgi:hypothetical protein
MNVVLLSLLQLKHFLVDWVLQTQYQIDNKGRYLHPGGLTHSIQHGLFTAAIFMLFGSQNSFTAGLLDFVLHYHIDWLKVNVSKGLTPADKRFWVLMGADQLAHQLTYLALVGTFSGM